MATIRAQLDRCRKLKINNTNQGEENYVNKEDILKDKLAILSDLKQIRKKLKQ